MAASTPRGPRPLPAPEPVDIGIVAALPIEVGPLRDLMTDASTIADPGAKHRPVVEGRIGGKVVALIVAGVGRSMAPRGTPAIAGRPPAPLDRLGGLRRGARPGPEAERRLPATEVVDGTSPTAAAGDRHAAAGVAAGVEIRYASGRLVTASEVVRTAAEKAELRRRFEADVVDMETASVAALCADRGTRFLSVRVISDEAGDDLPPEVMTIMGPTGGFRLGATIGAFWKRPGSVKDLWALREHAVEAAERLAEVLPGILGQLD